MFCGALLEARRPQPKAVLPWLKEWSGAKLERARTRPWPCGPQGPTVGGGRRGHLIKALTRARETLWASDLLQVPALSARHEHVRGKCPMYMHVCIARHIQLYVCMQV